MTFHHFPTLFKICSYLHMGVKYFQIAWRLKKHFTSLPFSFVPNYLTFPPRSAFPHPATHPCLYPLSPYEMIRDGKNPPLLILMSEHFFFFQEIKKKEDKTQKRDQAKHRDESLKLKQKQFYSAIKLVTGSAVAVRCDERSYWRATQVIFQNYIYLFFTPFNSKDDKRSILCSRCFRCPLVPQKTDCRFKNCNLKLKFT